MAEERGAGARRPTSEGSGGGADSPSVSGRARPRPFASFRPLARTIPVAPGEVDEGQLSHAALRRDTVYRRALAVADMLAGALSLGAAIVLLGEDRLEPSAVAVLPVVVIAAKAVGLYDRDEHLLKKTTLDEAPTLFYVATLYALIAWLAGGLLVDGAIGRDQLLGLWLLVFVLMLAGRGAARRVARALAAEERCLVIGEGTAAEWARRTLARSHVVKATLVGFVSMTPGRSAGVGVPTLGTLESLADVIAEHGIDRVLIAPETSDAEETLEVIRLVKVMGVKVSVLPRLLEVVGSSVEFDDVDGMTLLGVRRYGLTQSSRMLKRGMDLAGSVALLVILAPMLLMIAAAIKLSSQGPVLFRQRRVGQNDRAFEMLKFRTMVDGADGQREALYEINEASGGLFKIAEDPRVTRVGGYLRRTSLDELPQLINVLRGEMSLVGPRPLVVDEDARVQGWRRRRLMMPPGMTGLWQVFGSARIPLDEMVKIDYLYGTNWSLWSDVKILIRTLPYVFGRRGM